jgi:hypothetical protein
MTSAERRLVPDGWAPRPGGHVRLLPDPKAAPDVPPPPPGVWWVVDRAPEATHWWVYPWDAEAKVWAGLTEVNRRIARSLSMPSRLLTPARTAVRGLP